MAKQKQSTMGQFFAPLPESSKGQTLLTKFFTSSNTEENKFQYLFEREEARRKKLEQQEKEKIERIKEEERQRKKKIKEQERIEAKKQFEEDQQKRWEEEKLKHEGKFIIDGLYLGSRFVAKNYDWINGHVTAILNVSQEVKNYFEGEYVVDLNQSSNHFSEESENKDSSNTQLSSPSRLLNYKRIVCQDATDQNLSQFFSEAISFIENIIKEGGSVLVHCREGLSRSPSTIIAFLMQKKDWSLDKSYSHLLDCNKKLRINDGFKRQLMQYELSIFNTNSLDFFNKRTTRTSNSTTTLSQDEMSLVPNSTSMMKNDVIIESSELNELPILIQLEDNEKKEEGCDNMELS